MRVCSNGIYGSVKVFIATVIYEFEDDRGVFWSPQRSYGYPRCFSDLPSLFVAFYSIFH